MQSWYEFKDLDSSVTSLEDYIYFMYDCHESHFAHIIVEIYLSSTCFFSLGKEKYCYPIIIFKTPECSISKEKMKKGGDYTENL